MLNFDSVMLFSQYPKKLSDFYAKVFEKDPDWADNNYFGFVIGKGFITIGPHDKVKEKNTNPERFLFNFQTKEVEKEFARVEKLGAKVIAKPYHPGEDKKTMISTFADPDGNFFQLTTPWEGEK